MCNLCSLDPKERAIAEKCAYQMADRLHALATAYRDMASRRMAPHGEEAKHVALNARTIVRELVNEWI